MEQVLTDANFETEVLRSAQPVLVDFWAPWCGPCRILGPIVEEVAGEVKDAKVGKLNVDENPATASKYGVMSIPTIKIFKGGQVVKEMVGVQSKETLLAEIKAANA
jgi:thioredoxin 1